MQINDIHYCLPFSFSAPKIQYMKSIKYWGTPILLENVTLFFYSAIHKLSTVVKSVVKYGTEYEKGSRNGYTELDKD